MELRVIWRGGLSGIVAGLLAFVFAKVLTEPLINKSIDYESGRDDAINALRKAAGLAVDPEGPDIVSRHVQSTWGIMTGLVGFGLAMGLIVAVVYLVLHGRFSIQMRTLALTICGFGFLGIFLMPFLKYPANPPAIGHEFTIHQRGQLYLVMVGSSLILLVLGTYAGHRLAAKFGVFYGSLIAAAGVLVVFAVLIGLLPSLGNLHANVAHAHDIGYGRSSTETPLPITDAQGNIVYPGFPADVLWKFRWYSVINQLLIWTTIGLCFSALLLRMFRGPKPSVPTESTETPVPAAV
ncbi:MAG TPA: CbtA family protein [Mycobacteriales bacterium]|nr:CbtA family protein [Mycobacteriales bacterium]